MQKPPMGDGTLQKCINAQCGGQHGQVSPLNIWMNFKRPEDLVPLMLQDGVGLLTNFAGAV
ncbi:hypothetical protein K504DRAFT_464888, partial [Pleomassaria siparia CBS 279.74]